MKFITACAFLLFTFSASAQKSLLGKKSPELTFDTILNFEKPDARLIDFKGKVVILDFWATYCGPCIQSFPHLEALQSKFSSDIQILTITDDSPERIKRFLENRVMKLPIVIDQKRALSKVFPHGVIPHTVVIDQSGTIKAITTPDEVTEALIKKILLGQEVNIEEKSDVRNFDPSSFLSGNGNFTYQITITPYKDGCPSYSNTTGGEAPYLGRRILVTNFTARGLFELAYQFPPVIRTVVDVSDRSKFEWNKQNAVCFDLIVPEELGAQRFDIMKQQLGVYFGYQTYVEERLRPVKVLRRINGTEMRITESKVGTKPYSNFSRTKLSMKGAPIGKLAGFLEDQIHIPVVDETNLDGLYDVEIPWYNENPDKIHEELKKIGLEIIDEERRIKMLVIKDK